MSGEPYDPVPDLAALLAAIQAEREEAAFVLGQGAMASFIRLREQAPVICTGTPAGIESAVRKLLSARREHDRQRLRDVGARARNAGLRL